MSFMNNKMENMIDRIQNLPYDLQEYVYKWVCFLRVPKKVFNDELLKDIETFHLMEQIKRNYKQVFPNDYLNWIENGLINVLNENRGCNAPFQECFYKLFPQRTEDEIHSLLRYGSYTKQLWKIASPRQRIVLKDISRDMLFHYI